MAASLAFGILFATVMTLFLIPALYLILQDFSNWWRNAWLHVLPERLKPATAKHHDMAKTAESRASTSSSGT